MEKKMNHIPLHVHDYYSVLDGYSSPEEYMKRAKELDITHIAQTNHGTLAGHRHFQRAAKEANLVPILGVEAYFSTTDRFDRRSKSKRQDSTNIYNHIVILAQNENGLRNLHKASEIAWTEGYYNKPRLDFDVLKEYNEDLIVLSGCMRGPICDAFLNDDELSAQLWTESFKEVFEDRFYIEVQDHNPIELNQFLLSMADKYDIKPVITDDCHYADPKQKWLEEAFLILSSNRKKAKDLDMTKANKLDLLEKLRYMYPAEIDGKRNGISYDDLELFLANSELRKSNLEKGGITRIDIFENTHEIAQRIGDYPYYSGLTTIPINNNADDVLRKMCQDGMKKRGLEGKSDYEERLTKELKVISDKSFQPYFLIVSDALQWAKNNDIMVGPGRGSSAGSLVCYVMEITEIDPLKYGLLFERFLDPERDDWPDIDTDIEDARRGEVKTYLEQKYGNVASISTITFYKDKVALKDAARVMGVPFSEANKLIKDFPSDENTIHEFEKSSTTLEFRKKYPDVMSLAKELRGRVRSVGMHAAGLIISNDPITDYTSIESRPKPNGDGVRIPAVAVDMEEVDKIGLVKIDLLGLSNLTVIKNCIKMIKERHGKIVDPWNLPLDDYNTFRLLQDGLTSGVFQFEQGASTKVLARIEPKEFNDLVVATSLVRTGAWKAIGEDYLLARKGVKPSKVIHESTRYFTEETLFFVVYQEQLMRLCTDLAGMSIGDANQVRRITAKKKDPKLLLVYKEKFINGCKGRVSVDQAEKLWHSFEIAAEYMFNKSHAVAYCVIAYATAYLKANYPLEYMCSLLINEGKGDKITDYLLECKNMGISIKLPHVNSSELDFSIDGDGLRFGLTSVKYIKEKAASKIIEYRPFDSYEHFKNKVFEKGSGLNSRVLDSLNKIGGTVFKDRTRDENYKENLYEYLGVPAFNTNMVTNRMRENMRDLSEYQEDETFICMGMVKILYKKDTWARLEIVDSSGVARVFIDPNCEIEKGKMYLFLIGNNSVIKYIELSKDLDASEDIVLDYLRRPVFSDIEPGQYKIIAGKQRVTKQGKNMATLVICDEDKNLLTLPVWPKMFDRVRALCKIGSVRAIDIGKMPDGTKFVKDVF
jgi:DNA polymerase III subunit alpha